MKTLNNSIRFKDKNGKLTVYAFICGYVEEKTIDNVRTQIWRDGGCNFYNIRRHDFNTGKRIFWESAKTIKEARKIFNRK